MTLLQRMEALRAEQQAPRYRILSDDELRAHGVTPMPGPTRHPVVTDRDVTWFMWAYAVAFFAAGYFIGSLVMFLIN